MREIGGLEFIEKSFLKSESRRVRKNACWALSYLPNTGILLFNKILFYLINITLFNHI
jgi:hypothetical protein